MRVITPTLEEIAPPLPSRPTDFQIPVDSEDFSYDHEENEADDVEKAFNLHGNSPLFQKGPLTPDNPIFYVHKETPEESQAASLTPQDTDLEGFTSPQDTDLEQYTTPPDDFTTPPEKYNTP